MISKSIATSKYNYYECQYLKYMVHLNPCNKLNYVIPIRLYLFSSIQPCRRAPALSESGNVNVTSLKHELQFKLKVKVTIHDLTGIPSNENKPLFCVFEVS